MKTILVTGAAGFIGYHTAKLLLERGDQVIGFDNLSDFYDVGLKQARLSLLAPFDNFQFVLGDVSDAEALRKVFVDQNPTKVIHLAAQASARYSIENPAVYVQANLVGFANVLENCRQQQAEHLVYASSSSVYGANTKLPFSEHDHTDHPVSLYAATKKANEVMAHSYSHLFGLPTTGLRFFTVYGPWGRPDMSPVLFASAILKGEPIKVFNEGKMQRDFTYVDDIVDGILRTLDNVPQGDPAWSGEAPSPSTSAAPFRIYNIGNNQPLNLLSFISLMEEKMGRQTEKLLMPMQPGDVVSTFADIDAIQRETGFRPSTPPEIGLERFTDWFKTHYCETGFRGT